MGWGAEKRGRNETFIDSLFKNFSFIGRSFALLLLEMQFKKWHAKEKHVNILHFVLLIKPKSNKLSY